MYHREFPVTPSQSAVTGSMDIYVEGQQKNSAKQMLFGLSVLRTATEAQLQVAMKSVQLSRQLTDRAALDVFALLGSSAHSGSAKTLPAPSTPTEEESWRALSSPVRNDQPMAVIR